MLSGLIVHGRMERLAMADIFASLHYIVNWL